MKFRPCIDIHNGKVKQIVGGSLRDEGNQANTNFTSELDAAWYAGLYQKDRLKGGHIILLNPEGSEYYEETKRQALEALRAYPQGMQIVCRTVDPVGNPVRHIFHTVRHIIHCIVHHSIAVPRCCIIYIAIFFPVRAIFILHRLICCIISTIIATSNCAKECKGTKYHD